MKTLSQGLERYRAGQTGLLRLSWDNGDRTVLVNSELGGVTLGWNLMHTAQDELFAAIEGTAFHTRIILERMAEHGVPVERVINAGGIPQNNAVLNQVYANVLNKPVLVPDGVPTSLGSGIFALVAAGAFPASRKRRKRCVWDIRLSNLRRMVSRYMRKLFKHYRDVYLGLGSRSAALLKLGDVFAGVEEDCRFGRSRRLIGGIRSLPWEPVGRRKSSSERRAETETPL